MELNTIDEQSVLIATKVIIYAGNAKQLLNAAVKAAEGFDFDLAEEKIKEAEAELKEGHKTQTKFIQAEARGEEIEVSLLLTHAQDSLMTSLSDVQFAKHIINVYKAIEKINK